MSRLAAWLTATKASLWVKDEDGGIRLFPAENNRNVSDTKWKEPVHVKPNPAEYDAFQRALFWRPFSNTPAGHQVSKGERNFTFLFIALTMAAFYLLSLAWKGAL